MSQENVQLHISGMNCQACATRIEKVLNKNTSVKEATVNFASEDARVTYDSDKLALDDLIEIINKTGFEAKEKSKNILDAKSQDIDKISWRLIALWTITVPFLVSMLGMLTNQHALMMPYWLQFILSTIVQLFLARPIYKSAIASIKGGVANMDVLVILGTSAIWLFSSIMYFFSDNHDLYIYFEANVMVIAFISLGKYIEAKAKHNSLNSLNDLLSLFPSTAMIFKNNEWVNTPYDKIIVGDLVKSTTGEKICADGVIESGFAWVNESHLTGESLPVEKKSGDSVLAGSIVSDGSISYQVSTLGEDTLLGDMVAALNDSQSTKASIARIADRVAAVFVPVVIAIALITLIITYFVTHDFSQALIHAVSVLVIACPCALGLATPAAIMVGMGVGSKNGIWFKNAEIMEATASINTVVLDKTGTFTQGNPTVSSVWLSPNANIDEKELLRITASIEQNSTHPLAMSIVREAKNKNLQLIETQNINNVAGSGLEGSIEGIGQVKVGNLAYTKLNLPEHLDPIWDISSIIAVSINDEAVGAFALSDPLKTDSKESIAILKEHDILPYIMSGDKQSVVNYVANEVGIPINQALGGLSPRDKASEVTKLMQSGQKVAMVGDGINDAPALATATVGIAMGDGSDIANQTSGITLVHHTVKDVVNALYIGQKTMKNIKQNLFFAFVYNIIGIPLAAFGFLTPVIAGIAMSLSSISVILNALRLKYSELLPLS
ncbi:heavy metal translocating P-type ATPase [Neisseriaceae bacterium PsAf]|nr:heavy metal translocating P-type ATPase [Neisseriaceae bacterium PsAf]